MINIVKKNLYNKYYSKVNCKNAKKFLNSSVFFDYAVSIGSFKKVLYIMYSYGNKVLIFHILFRNNFIYGTTSYYEPIFVIDGGIDDFELITFKSNFYKDLRLFLIKNGVTRHQFNFMNEINYKIINNVFRLAKVEEQNTLIIDFSSDKSYNSSFNRSLIRSLRKVDYNNVKIKEGNSLSLFLEFSQYYDEFEIENGRKSLLRLDSTLREVYNLMPKEYYIFYIMYYKDKAISVIGIERYEGIWTEILSSTSVRAFELKIPASHLLHDHVIKSAYNHGSFGFDLAGLNNVNISKKQDNINKFKLNFSHNLVLRYMLKTYFPHI